MRAREINKIWASPKLLAEYHSLAEEMRDSGIQIPPPVYAVTIDYMREKLASLRVAA